MPSVAEIKAKYPKYAGWNDAASILADFNAGNAGAPSGGGGGGFTVPNFQEYVTKANQSLDAYYTRILEEEKGDVERAKRRLEEDYKRGMRVSTEDYVKGTTRAVEDTDVAKTQTQALETQENRQLEGNLARRGVSQGGVAQTLTGEQSERQRLRREAIDRALKRQQEDLQYGKERSQEGTTINQRRGTEDIATAYAKFLNQSRQEREEKALGLGEQAYNRDFQRNQAEQAFRLQGA